MGDFKGEAKPTQKNKNTIREYFKLGEVANYFFRKKDPERPVNFSLKMMHGVNKISIIIFLVGMILFVVKKMFFNT